MNTTDLNDYLPRLAALRARRNHSVNIELNIWMHRHGDQSLPTTYSWGVWDGTTHHMGATLDDAMRAAEHAAANHESEPVDVLVIPERAVHDENA